MYHLFYPQKTQSLFTNRMAELQTLEFYKDRLLRGEADKIAFIGTRRIGKSTILYEFMKRHHADRRLLWAYVNLQHLVIEPLSFAKSYIGLITKWVVKDRRDNFPRYEDPEFCMVQLQKVHRRAVNHVYQFIKASQAREISLKSLLEYALSFPNLLSECLNRPIIVIIDEFQEITDFRNFKQMPEILGFMRAVTQAHNRILYIFAGSYVRLMRNIIDQPDSPFFAQIKPYYVNHFDKENSRLYLAKLCRKIPLELSTEIEQSILQATAGHPYYLELLTHALGETQRREELELTAENIHRVLLLQLVNEKSPLYQHLRYIYEDALAHARGSAILHGALKVLAKDEALTVTEIAERLSRKPAAIQIVLAELMKVDLVARKEKLYLINDPLLRWWIYFKFYHPEGAFSLQDRIVQELADDFREKYLQAAAELGRAKEFELYYFVSKMQGKRVGAVTLPAFKTLIKNYVLPNGDEIDLFARNAESWVFELKWKNKLIGVNEFKKLKKKIQVDRYVLISKKGFTQELMTLAKKSSEVILWDAAVMAQE